MDDHLSQLEALVKTNTEANNQLICQQIAPIEMSTLLSPYGETLLHWAAADNNSIMCQYLITQKKIQVNPARPARFSRFAHLSPLVM